MSAPTRRRATPADVPGARPKLSGCALAHTVNDCDCLPPGTSESAPVGCRECWGSGDYCGACGGWGETTKYGRWVHGHVAGSGATGPSTTDDPWADAPVDPWTDSSVLDAPF